MQSCTPAQWLQLDTWYSCLVLSLSITHWETPKVCKLLGSTGLSAWNDTEHILVPQLSSQLPSITCETWSLPLKCSFSVRFMNYLISINPNTALEYDQPHYLAPTVLQGRVIHWLQSFPCKLSWFASISLFLWSQCECGLWLLSTCLTSHFCHSLSWFRFKKLLV